MIILSHLYHLYLHPPPISTLFPYTTLFRSQPLSVAFSVALNTAHQLIDARYLLIQKHLRIGARRADDNLLRILSGLFQLLDQGGAAVGYLSKYRVLPGLVIGFASGLHGRLWRVGLAKQGQPVGMHAQRASGGRSEERRVGKEWRV